VTNIKVILFVLLRKFTFKFSGGPESKIDIMRRVTPRPKDVDADGSIVRMRIRAVE
jgi:ABC-type dipeptide/oligopeptide/nickel transport system ATPase subunit